nr:integrase, catalytic region, zinc finger, CCHC-type, peptidase aspartic, catalytic [Tanacetum cinerariifolium]
AMGSKKKIVVVTSNPLALIAKKTNVSRSKEKVVVSSNSEGSEADDFSELKKITTLLEKAFNRRKFYSKLTNNLRTSSSSESANKKQEFVKTDNKRVEKKDDEKKRDMSRVKCYNCKKEGHFATDCKKVKVKDYEYYKTKMLLAKKDKDEQVLLAEDQAWMESRKASSSFADEKIFDVSYYLSESESEYEFETSEYYDNSTNYGLFMNNDDDQEIFHDAINSASENLIKNHIYSQKDYDKSDVDHNDSKEKDHLVDKKGIGFENLSYFEKEKDLRPTLYDEKVIGLGVSNLNKNVKRYSCKDLLAYNNSHLGETRSDFVCKDAMNVSCDPRMNDLLDDNNFFIFADVNVRISFVSKMPFRKKPCDSLHVDSKSNMIKSLPRTVHKTIRFGNNYFAMIAGYGDVVIGSMTIKNVYYVEGLGHNLFSVGQFCDKGLEVVFR